MTSAPNTNKKAQGSESPLNKRKIATTIPILLVLTLSFICSTTPQTQDTPLIIYPGLDGIATVTPEYNVFVTPHIVVDANTTFTNVIRLYCPGGYTDRIGIANLTLNPSQIKELQIFVAYYGVTVLLCHYREGSIIQNNTFPLYPEHTAIMGMSIVPNVTKAGTIDPISYQITCGYGLRDVAVTGVSLSATEIYVGKTLNIEVSVKNEGTRFENFSVTPLWEGLVTGSQAVTNLAPGAETTLTFNWPITGVAHGNYTIKAVASKVPDESDLADNTYTARDVKVKVLGDIDENGFVDADDVFTYLAPAYGSKIGDPRYDPRCDFDGDGYISADDVFTYLAPNYGYAEKFVIAHPVILDGKTYRVITETNSTVTGFAFSRSLNQISFNVTGPHDTSGYCKVKIPSDLLIPVYTVFVDDVKVKHTYTGGYPNYIISFSYSLSTRKVRIIGYEPVGG